MAKQPHLDFKATFSVRRSQAKGKENIASFLTMLAKQVYQMKLNKKEVKLSDFHETQDIWKHLLEVDRVNRDLASITL